MQGRLTHFEVGVADGARAKAFYGALLGWTFHTMGDGESGWIETDGVRGGLNENNPSPEILPYFEVADIETALAQVRELGGQAGEAGPNEPGFGRFAECQDNQGIRFGLNQPSTAH